MESINLFLDFEDKRWYLELFVVKCLYLKKWQIENLKVDWDTMA